MPTEKAALSKYVQHRFGRKNIQATIQIYQHLTGNMSDEGVQLLDTL